MVDLYDLIWFSVKSLVFLTVAMFILIQLENNTKRDSMFNDLWNKLMVICNKLLWLFLIILIISIIIYN